MARSGCPGELGSFLHLFLIISSSVHILSIVLSLLLTISLSSWSTLFSFVAWPFHCIFTLATLGLMHSLLNVACYAHLPWMRTSLSRVPSPRRCPMASQSLAHTHAQRCSPVLLSPSGTPHLGFSLFICI